MQLLAKLSTAACNTVCFLRVGILISGSRGRPILPFRWDGDRSESRNGEAGTGRVELPEDGEYRDRDLDG